MSPLSRFARPLHAGWGAAVIVLITLLIIHVASQPPIISGDSAALVQGTHNIVACLGDGVARECNAHLGPTSLGVPQFPPLQYLPALAFERIALDDMQILKGLAVINVLAFAGLVALVGYVGLRTGRSWAAPLLVLVVVASPLVVYSRYTFGENVAGLLLAAPVAAALLRTRPWLIGVLVMAAGLTKETSVVFVAPACILALWATPLGRDAMRRSHVILVGAGSVVSLAGHGLLNQFRYGTFTNEVYTNPVLQVRGVEVPAKFFVSLWAAPNAGAALFWPAAAIVMLVPVVVLLTRLRRAPRDHAMWMPAAGVVALLLLHTASLARWASPFGWVAWGPRLILPLLPLLALLAVVLHLDATERALGWIGHRILWRFATVVLLGVALVPQVGVLFETQAIGRFFEPDPNNAHCPRVPSMAEGEFYYGCIVDLAWRRPSPLIDASSGVTRGLGPIYGVVFIGSAAVLVREATRRDPTWSAPADTSRSC